MDYYIIGYTSAEYSVGSILLPKKVYTAEEKVTGKKEVTKVSEDELAILRTNKVFVALENTKKIRVLDQLPSWAVSGADREAALLKKIKELESKKAPGKVTALEAELTAAKAATETVTTEAQKVIDELRAENEQLKAAKDKE